MARVYANRSASLRARWCARRRRSRYARQRLGSCRHGLWRLGARRHHPRLHVDIGSCSSRWPLTRVKVAGRNRSSSDRRRRLDTHRPHPCPLRRRLGIGPGEVRSGREILNVIVHIPARWQGHAGIFHLAADRGQDPARRQRCPKRHASPRGPSRRSHAGQPHSFHPPWHIRRSLGPIP
jgi:hypothetical protein